MRVLLVENDRSKFAQLSEVLKPEGVQVETTNNGEDALILVRHYDFDIMLLSVMLPDMPGSTVVSRMRIARCDIPVLAISPSATLEHKLKALAAGADDVVDRTIDPTELLARMRAIVRRSRGYSQPKLRIGALSLDIEQQVAEANGQTIQLTGKEFAILQLLMMRKNMIMTKEAILTSLYGGMDEPEIKIIDVFVCKLRKKLAEAGVANFIGTVWGRGYTVRDQPGSNDHPEQPQTPRPARPVVPELLTA